MAAVEVKVWYDDGMKVRNGQRHYYVSWWCTTRLVRDGELVWHHISYGLMGLYRLHKVDGRNYIEEDTHLRCWTSNRNWDRYSKKPEDAYLELKIKQLLYT